MHPHMTMAPSVSVITTMVVLGSVVVAVLTRCMAALMVVLPIVGANSTYTFIDWSASLFPSRRPQGTL